MKDKTLGYIFVILGLIIAIFAVFRMYGVFSGKLEPFSVFETQGIALDMSNIVGENLSAEQINQLKESGALRTQLVEKEIVDKVLNMSSFSFYYFFVAWFGFKLAGTGVRLARPIKVKLKETIVA